LERQAIVKSRFRARGRDSGVTFDEPIWQAISFRDGRARWWDVYASEAEALKAVGLEE
jgi:hypothetical protein